MITPAAARKLADDCEAKWSYDPTTKALRDLAQQVEDLQKDAARYRWLRECSPVSSTRGAVTINWPIFEEGRLMRAHNPVSHEELDNRIDRMLK
jgi:hypothetical protein